MHLTSTLNPLSKSDGNIPVAIFCFGEKCKFLTLSESYEETLESACDVFDIDSLSVHMRTSALDVCKGRSIAIDPTVYTLIWTVLDEIELVLDESGGSSNPGSGSGSRKRKSGKALQKIPSRSPSPGTPPLKRAAPVVADPPKRVASAVVDPPALAGPSKLPIISSREFLDSSSDTEGHVESRVINDKDGQRITGIEGGIITWKKFKPVVLTPALPATREVEPAPPAVVKEEGAITWKKFKPVSLTPALPAPREAEPSPPAVVKEEKISEPERSAPKPKDDTDAVTINEDARFDITINGPQPGQIAQFKTRAPHTVKKVLSAACKTFNIKYENAYLSLCVPLVNEDGQVESHNFECDAGETMAMCGITTQSKLVVRIRKPDVGDEGFTADV